jgi:hypothetical protein
MAFDRASRLGACLLLTTMAIVSPARAEPASGQRELARELMKRGNQLRAAQDLEGALEAFRAADAIMHVPTTGFEVARSELQLGQLVEARDVLMRVERIPASPDEPQAFKEARDYARQLDVEIGPRIPRIRLSIEGAAEGVAVTIDGESVPSAALDIPYAADPGKHAVAARTPDGRAAAQEVTLEEGEEREVLLVLPGESPAPPPPPASKAPVATPRAAPSDRHALAWVAFGTAGGAAVVGAATGIVAWTRASSVSARCNGEQCPPSTYADLDAARGFATASTVSFIVAGVATVAGVVIVLTAPRAPARATGRGTGPSLGIGPMGVAGTF